MYGICLSGFALGTSSDASDASDTSDVDVSLCLPEYAVFDRQVENEIKRKARHKH